MSTYYVPGTLLGKKMYTREVGDVLQPQMQSLPWEGTPPHAKYFKTIYGKTKP